MPLVSRRLAALEGLPSLARELLRGRRESRRKDGWGGAGESPCSILAARVPWKKVRPIVFYLTPGEEGREPADRDDLWVDGRLVFDFRFDTVRLWEIDPEELLGRLAPGQWSVVALARGAGIVHVHRARERLEREVEDVSMRRELLAVLFVVSGMRMDPETVRAVIPREVLMESSTAQELIPEGRILGREEGREKGREEGLANLRDACRRLAVVRLGSLGPTFESRLAAMDDASALKDLLVEIGAAADAASVQTILDRLGK